MSHSFVFGSDDAYGCTFIDKDVFLDTLDLTHTKPIVIRRVSGEKTIVHAVKCTTIGRRYYQVDLSDMRIGVGATVILRPSFRLNSLLMTVVERPVNMWKNRGVVDAIVELQHEVSQLKEVLMGDDEGCD